MPGSRGSRDSLGGLDSLDSLGGLGNSGILFRENVLRGTELVSYSKWSRLNVLNGTK